MWLNSLKWLAFAVLVLLLGQVPVGSTKIGEKFFHIVKETIFWGGDEVRESRVYASITGSSVFKRWLTNVYPPNVPPKSAESLPAVEPSASDESEPENDSDDTFTATDRESILRLLD